MGLAVTWVVFEMVGWKKLVGWKCRLAYQRIWTVMGHRICVREQIYIYNSDPIYYLYVYERKVGREELNSIYSARRSAEINCMSLSDRNILAMIGSPGTSADWVGTRSS